MRSLYEINQAYLDLLNKVDPETGEVLFSDEDIDSIAEEYEQKADNIACLIKDKEATIKARKSEMESLKERNEREQKQVDYLKRYLLQSLRLRNVKKLETVRNVIRMRNTVSVQVENDAVIPEQYIRTKVTSEPNKAEIGKALKEGIMIPGCALLEKTSITIK